MSTQHPTGRGKTGGLDSAAVSGDPKKRPAPAPVEDNGKGWPPSKWGPLLWYAIFMVGTLWFWQEASRQLIQRTIPYSEFKDLLAQGQVQNVEVGTSDIKGEVVPRPKPKIEARTTVLPPETSGRPARSSVSEAGTPHRTNSVAETNKLAASAELEKKKTAAVLNQSYAFRTVRVDDPDLVRDLQKAHIVYAGVRPGVMSQLIWAWILPIGAMFLLWRWLSRGMGSLGQGIMSFGSSKAKVVADQDTGVTFNDVAGCDEAKVELEEIVSFLKNPDRYRALGAVIPKGILLIGPPGTGKTLLARAVAGEAKVPFFLISGSDFVEMFVGVGAARVRDLFEKAKTQAPCIVFIDELDAVGRQRGVHLGPVNDEREQTLNQLLVGMDGFEANVGVIILAATNRPEVLDRALLRPGRFDRQVLVDAPDIDGRFAILGIHVRNKPLSAGVDLRKLAQQTPGFSGADLANVVNEAALLAARRQAHEIRQTDLEDAVEKVVAGPERRSRRLGQEEKRQVAYHETGHALVAAYSKYADPVHKITIVPHGHAALGYTMQLPTEDHFLLRRSALLDKLKGQLGGRAAEEVVFGEVSTGAENDLQHATTLARQMVAMFGMSELVGLAHCAQPQHPVLLGTEEALWQRDCSDQTAREIDEEVKKILGQSYGAAKEILMRHRAELDLVAGELLQRETLNRNEFQNLLEKSQDETHKNTTAAAFV